MATQTDFIEWALSPQRTLEEAYCAERLVEQGYMHWCITNRHEHPSYQKQAAFAHKRRLNPAHRAKLKKVNVTRAAEKLATMTYVSLDAHSDRPLRDISALRFFPAIKTLSLYGHEFTDISVLRLLPALETLSMSSDELEDFTPLAALTGLKSLHLYVRQPWPVVKGLEALTELESFNWNGNLLPLEDIPRLGKVRDAKINFGAWSSLPVRNATRLPEMPWLEELELDGLHRLDGITRWPRLRNLVLGGPFKDLRPLAGLRGLTHLTLKGELTRDLSPLAQLPDLRRLTIQSEHPQDYSVLAETPRLHEVIAQGCKINQMELSTLHAVLAPWEDEFAVPEPRPRGRARFVIREQKLLPADPRKDFGPETRWHDDKQMIASEANWFQGRLTSALNGLFGRKGWGRAWCLSNGMGWININTLEAAEQLAVIVETTRQLLCSTARPWHVHVALDLDSPDEDWDDEMEDEEEDEERALQQEIEEIKDYKKQRKEEEAFREREHRMRLLAQEGKEVKPEEFAVPDETKTFTAADTEEDDEDEDEDADDSPASSEATKVKEEKLWMHAIITEEGLFADDRGRAAAEHLMGRKAEDAAA